MEPVSNSTDNKETSGKETPDVNTPKEKPSEKAPGKTILADEKHYYEIATAVFNSPTGAQVQRHSDIINHKAAAALTHISIMIAVSIGGALSPPENPDSLTNIFIYLETLGYITLAMIALFGALITPPQSFAGYEQAKIEPALERFIAIVRRRRISLRTSIYGAYVITPALMITLALKFFWRT